MIKFPTIYPYKITNGSGSTLCGISAGTTLVIGPSNISGTITLYNSYAELVEQYLANGTFGGQDMSDNWLASGIAASAFSNLRTSVTEYQKTSCDQMNNLTVAQYVKLTPITTAVRDSIPQDTGTLVLNSDTNEIEVRKSGGWGTSTGAQGARGYQGYKGNTGSAGSQGARGYQGYKGNTGSAGSQGARGYQGYKGNTGSTGAQGARGYQGSSVGTVYDAVVYDETSLVNALTSSTIGSIYVKIPATSEFTLGSSVTNLTLGSSKRVYGEAFYLNGCTIDISSYTIRFRNDKIDVTTNASTFTGTGSVLIKKINIQSSGTLIGISGKSYFENTTSVSALTNFTQLFWDNPLRTTTAMADGQVLAYSASTGVWTPANAGAQGARGYQGYKGTTGSAGSQGARGYQGYKGNTGNTGAQGARGYQGYKGNTGNTGAQGARGYKGTTGSAGSQGARGYQGYKGTTGSAGSQGARGYQGYRGYQGPSVSTSGLVANVSTNKVSTISVVSALPGSPDANTLYFIMG